MRRVGGGEAMQPLAPRQGARQVRAPAGAGKGLGGGAGRGGAAGAPARGACVRAGWAGEGGSPPPFLAHLERPS